MVEGSGGGVGIGGVKARLTEADAKLRRLQTAIEAGVDPVALVGPINEAQALRAELDAAPMPSPRMDAEIYAMVDSLGDVGAALSSGIRSSWLIFT